MVPVIPMAETNPAAMVCYRRCIIALILISVACCLARDLFRSQRNPTDEAWLTRWSLVDMTRDIMRFYEIGNSEERAALAQVRTLQQLWSLLHQKFDIVGPIVPAPVGSRYLKDALGNA